MRLLKLQIPLGKVVRFDGVVVRSLAAGRAICGPEFNPQITLKALSFFGEGNLRNLPEDMKSRLVTAAREVDLDRLPKIDDRAPEPENKIERG
jgi:hypothetical protein